MLQHVGHILARVLTSGEVQRDLMSGRRDRDDATGKHTGAIVGRFTRQPQHPHARVVVVQHFALRRLPDQFVTCRLDYFRGFLHDLPLRGRGQRNAQQLFQFLQPMEGHSAAILQLRDHRRRGFVVLFRAHAFRLLCREHLSAGVAAQPFQFIHRSCQRRLAHDPHQHFRLFLFVHIAASAVRATIAGLQIRVRDLYLFCATKCVRAIAAVSGRLAFALFGLRLFSGRRSVLIPEYCVGLLSIPPAFQSFHQRMQRSLQLLPVRFAQRPLFRLVDNAVQFFHIHIDPAAVVLLTIPSVTPGSAVSADSQALL